MKFAIQTPETCGDCVFGEERGYACSLLYGEPCYGEGYEYNRPGWCPFDNNGDTIVADGVTVLKCQHNDIITCKNCMLRNEDGWCHRLGEFMPDEWFCADGRREEA